MRRHHEKPFLFAGTHSLLQQKWLWIAVVTALLSILLGLYLNGYMCNVSEHLYYHYNLPYSKSLPPLRSNFVGRERELKTITVLLDISHERNRIVSISGPPGFGKSALAIHVGHRMVAQGAVVYYVDMNEVSSMQALAEKILSSDVGIVSLRSISITRLERWANERHDQTILILDNCDRMLQTKGGGDGDKKALQKQLKRLLESTSHLKILMTSRKDVSQFDLQRYRLQELTAESACSLLEKEVSQHGWKKECITIANLTGNVPIALKVVGTLLRQPDAPDFATIIDALQTRLMSTLSPNEFPPEEQVNASIAISYEYLSPPQQKVGRYLAIFPGSFSIGHTCEIFSDVFQGCDCTCTCEHVESLVRRSLLEHNKRTNRYQFHHLIKEFFLSVQISVGEMGKKERKRFFRSFHWHYSHFMEHLSKEFPQKYAAVLKVLDEERHNFEYLLQHFTSPAMCGSTSECIASFHVVELALGEGVLQSRFTTQELYGPIRDIVRYQDWCATKAIHVIASPYRVEVYVSFLLTLARLESDREGLKEAAQTLERRINLIEILDLKIPGKGAAVPYTRFYSVLSDYYSSLQDHPRVLDCDSRILKKTEELQKCEPGFCSYCDIGSAYYRLKRYEKSVYFLKNCLTGQGIRMTVIVRGVFLDYLLQSYKELGNSKESQAAEEELVDLFPRLMEESVVEFQRNPADVYYVISAYTALGKWKEVAALKEKYLKAAKELGREVRISDVRNAFEMAKMLYNNGSYESAADMGEFALKSLKRILEKTRDEHITLWLDITAEVGLAKYHSGNHSESTAYFETIIDFVYDYYVVNGTLPSESTETIIITFIGSCIYGPLHKLRKCSMLLYDGVTTIFTYLAVGYMQFAIQDALDVEPLSMDEHETGNVDTEFRPSFSTSLTVREAPAIGVSLLSHVPLKLWDSIKLGIKWVFNKILAWLMLFFKLVLSYTFVRRCINFSWILFKVCIPITILYFNARIVAFIFYKCYSFLYVIYIIVCTMLGF